MHLFWRVTGKPAFPLKNATDLHLFGASRESLLFHLKMHQICTFLARHEKTCFSTYRCNKFAPFWRVMRKPAFPLKMQQICTFWRVMRKPAFLLENAKNCTFLARHEKTCLSTKNALNLYLFGASRENLLFHLKCNKFAPFWRVTRKPAFPRNNGANLHLFGASRKKTCLFT